MKSDLEQTRGKLVQPEEEKQQVEQSELQREATQTLDHQYVLPWVEDTEQEKEFAAHLTAIRRHLHRNPELSGEEKETTAAIRSWLEEEGVRLADEYKLRTGLVAEVGQGNGPVVALRADIDALPIQEETKLEFASQIAGRMHACGHDAHTAILIGAAGLLKQRESSLPGKVRLIFQPSEEKATGARQVIQSGALADVQAIFGLHNKPDLRVGTVGIREGALMAAADGFVVKVQGVGTHAAVPEAGIDPIVVAAHIVTALQAIVSRNVGAQESAVLSVTKINSGTAWNVIPEEAILDGTVRTFDEKVRARIRERFNQVVAGVAAAYGTTATVRWIQGPPAVVNDASLALDAEQVVSELGLNRVRPLPSPAGEDFSFYQKEVPGLFLFLGTSGPHEWHHPGFDVDEQALPIGAHLLAELAEQALKRLQA
ncbi:amidohydrolase [Paenibacillus polysaccharolyticus]|uniref:Amidohydrolase n=1 Tax=Paenibacillus polysaccharolyticus TaxID=582692 RepID=A0A1G5HPW6_9BACL|nr:amidohydrolase [Paenibacillus polysaccharolyticus]SCY65754.1 amidohydrolase [Paenibacillus polysaccharolyticus]